MKFSCDLRSANVAYLIAYTSYIFPSSSWPIFLSHIQRSQPVLFNFAEADIAVSPIECAAGAAPHHFHRLIDASAEISSRLRPSAVNRGASDVAAAVDGHLYPRDEFCGVASEIQRRVRHILWRRHAPKRYPGHHL